MTIVNAVEVVTSTPRKPLDGSTLINIVLDETGSMNSCWDSTISSYNEYIGSQKTNQEGDCRVSLTTFSTSASYSFSGDPAPKNNVRSIYTNLPIADTIPLNKLNYRPSGGTNLYDAIGETIAKVERSLEGKDKVPNVLVVIITDGEENSSREYRLADIKNLIKAKEQDGWTFVYLGANQNAWQVGAAFGLSKGQTMTYSTADMDTTMKNLNAATSTYRSVRTRAFAAGDVSSTVAQDFFGNNGLDLTNPGNK